MRKNLDTTKPRCSEHIFPVPWPFVISRFHCTICFYYVVSSKWPSFSYGYWLWSLKFANSWSTKFASSQLCKRKIVGGTQPLLQMDEHAFFSFKSSLLITSGAPLPSTAFTLLNLRFCSRFVMLTRSILLNQASNWHLGLRKTCAAHA